MLTILSCFVSLVVGAFIGLKLCSGGKYNDGYQAGWIDAFKSKDLDHRMPKYYENYSQ